MAKSKILSWIKSLRNKRNAISVIAQEERYELFFDLWWNVDAEEPAIDEFEAVKELEKLLGIELSNEGHSDDALLVASKKWLTKEQLKDIYNKIDANDTSINDGRLLIDEYEASVFMYKKEKESYDQAVAYEDWDIELGDLDKEATWDESGTPITDVNNPVPSGVDQEGDIVTKPVASAQNAKLRLLKNDFNEYEVQWYENGKKDEEKTYYTDDKEDALATAKAIAEQHGLEVPTKIRKGSVAREADLFEDIKSEFSPNPKGTDIRDLNGAVYVYYYSPNEEALEWVNRVKEKYPNGVVYVDTSDKRQSSQKRGALNPTLDFIDPLKNWAKSAMGLVLNDDQIKMIADKLVEVGGALQTFYSYSKDQLEKIVDEVTVSTGLAIAKQTSQKRQALQLWETPDNYMGEQYHDYYVGAGQHRDSDALQQSNFEASLEMLGGEQGDEVMVVRSGHWAVGWVEVILVHKDSDKVETLQEIEDQLADYPVLDEDDFYQRERDGYQEDIESWAFDEAMEDIFGENADKVKEALTDEDEAKFKIAIEYVFSDYGESYLGKSGDLDRALKEAEFDKFKYIVQPKPKAPKDDPNQLKFDLDSSMNKKAKLIDIRENGNVRLYRELEDYYVQEGDKTIKVFEFKGEEKNSEEAFEWWHKNYGEGDADRFDKYYERDKKQSSKRTASDSVESIIDGIVNGTDEYFGYGHFSSSNMADYTLMSSTISDMTAVYDINEAEAMEIVQALTHKSERFSKRTANKMYDVLDSEYQGIIITYGELGEYEEKTFESQSEAKPFIEDLESKGYEFDAHYSDNMSSTVKPSWMKESSQRKAYQSSDARKIGYDSAQGTLGKGKLSFSQPIKDAFVKDNPSPNYVDLYDFAESMSYNIEYDGEVDNALYEIAKEAGSKTNNFWGDEETMSDFLSYAHEDWVDGYARYMQEQLKDIYVESSQDKQSGFFNKKKMDDKQIKQFEQMYEDAKGKDLPKENLDYMERYINKHKKRLELARATRQANEGIAHKFDVEKVLESFLEAGLWASMEDYDNSVPLDANYAIIDVAEESKEMLMDAIYNFLEANEEDLNALIEDDMFNADYTPEEQVGHDLFLTSQGHGVGFWDRGYGEIGETLSESSKDFFSEDPPYVGDDGKVYFTEKMEIKSNQKKEAQEDIKRQVGKTYDSEYGQVKVLKDITKGHNFLYLVEVVDNPESQHELYGYEMK